MKIYAIALFAVLGAACSSQQQQQDELQTSQDDEQAVDDQGNDGQNQENFEDEENQAQNDGEQVNNEVANDTQDDVVEGNLNAQGAQTAEVPVENVPVQEVPANPVPPTGGPDVAGGGGAPPPSAPSDAAPIPGGRVLYVPAGGVQIVNAPNGSPVADLQQGDHPLTWEEAGWIKLANGMFVPAGSLSEKGVPRAFPGNAFGAAQ